MLKLLTDEELSIDKNTRQKLDIPKSGELPLVKPNEFFRYETSVFTTNDIRIMNRMGFQ